jgi:hypothetical protein
MAYLTRKKLVDGILTEDSDLILMGGCPLLYKLGSDLTVKVVSSVFAVFLIN